MRDEFTIRTMERQIYGRFVTREGAWEVIERVRRSEHHESVHGANVVPLLAGVEPMPLDPRWLAECAEGPKDLDFKEILAAVDKLIGAYNDSRSERRGYRYVSGYLLTSDPDLAEAVRVLLAPIYREIEELEAHSNRFRQERDNARADADAARAEVAELKAKLDDARDRPWHADVSGR